MKDSKPVAPRPDRTDAKGPTPAPDPIRIHPRMAFTYQKRVSELISGLNDADGLHEAQEALRSLVTRIVLQPSAETGKLDIMLEGALSGLLALALFHKEHTQRHSRSKVLIILKN